MAKLLSSMVFVVLLLAAAVHANTYNDENDYTKTWVVASSYNDTSCGINLLHAFAFQSGVCVFISGTEWVKYTWDGTLITEDICTDSACTSCTSGNVNKGQCNLVNGSYVEYSVTIGLPPVASSMQTTTVYTGSACSGLVGLVMLNPTSDCEETACVQQDGNTSSADFCGFPIFANGSTYTAPPPTPSPGSSTTPTNDLTKHWLIVGNFNGSKCSTAQMTMGHAFQLEVCTMNSATQYVIYTTKNQTNGIAMFICTDSACTQCNNATKIQLNKCNATLDGAGYNAYFTSWGLPVSAAKANNIAIYDRASCGGVVSSVLIYPGVCQTMACYSLGNGRSASASCGYPEFAVGSTYGNTSNPGSGDINGFNTVNDFSKFWIVVSQYNDSKCYSNTFLMGNAYQLGVCAQKNSTTWVKYSYDGKTTTRLSCYDDHCQNCDPATKPILNQCAPSIYGGYVSFTYSQGLPSIAATVQTTALYGGGNCSGAVNMVSMTALQSGQICEAVETCAVGYNQSSTYSCGFPRFPLGSTFVPDTSSDSAEFNADNDMTKAWLVVESYNDSKCSDQFIHGKAYQVGVCTITAEDQYVRYTYDGANVISEVCNDAKCKNCAPYLLPLGTCAGATNGYSTYFFSQGLPIHVGKMESAAIYNGADCTGVVSSVEYEPISSNVNCSATSCALTDFNQSISYYCGFPMFADNSTFKGQANATNGDGATTGATGTTGVTGAPSTTGSSVTGSSGGTSGGDVTTATVVTVVVKMTGDPSTVNTAPIVSAIAASLGVQTSAVTATVAQNDPSKRAVGTFYLIITVTYTGLMTTPEATLQSSVAASLNSTTVQQAFTSQSIGVQTVADVSTSTTTVPTDAPTSAPTEAPTTGPTSPPNKIGSTGFAVTPSVILAFAAVVAISLL